MTSPGNGESVRFSVHMSEETRTILKALHAVAAQAGIGVQFVAAFRQIIERLQQGPLSFGERAYRLPALKLIVCKAVMLPLVVDFAVHEELPIVFIRGFKVLP